MHEFVKEKRAIAQFSLSTEAFPVKEDLNVEKNFNILASPLQNPNRHHLNSVWVVQPLLRLSMVIGYLPFVRSPHNGSLQRSPVRVAWTLLASAIHMLAAAYMTATVLLERAGNHVDEVDASYVMKCLLSLRYCVEVLAMLPSALWNFSSWDILSRNVANIDNNFVPESVATYRKRRRWVLLQFFLIFVLFLAPTILAALTWPESWFIQMIRGLGHFSHILMVLQYINVALFLKDKFSAVNESISGTFVPGSSAGPFEAYRLQQAHLHLTDAVEQVNAVFGWPVFALLCFLWGHAMMNTHYLLRSRAQYGAATGLASGALLLYTARETIVVIAICAAGDAVTTQARRTRRVLDHVLLRSLPVPVVGPLEAFRRQVTVAETHFSAGGIFRVELPLLAAFFGALVAYLVVLLQATK